MPLHRPAEALLRRPDGLDQPVRRDGHCPKAGREGADGLMVVAVDSESIPAQQRVQGRVRQHAEAVPGLVVGRALGVRHLGGVLQRKILIQRTAERGV